MKYLNSQSYNLKNIHLLLSAVIIIIAGLVYGVSPDKTLPGLFDFRVETTDLKNVFRAIMGLYLGMAAIWIIGIIKPGLWFTATLMNVIFMGGLAIGRLISLLTDGWPSVYFIAGLLAELLLAFWGVLNLTNFKK